MKIREGLQSSPGSVGDFKSASSRILVGRVYGIVMNENTPSKELFEKAGGWQGLGSIFYMDYDLAIEIEKINLDDCKIARPLFPNQKYYPLIGELVPLYSLPGVITQLVSEIGEKYYGPPINLWNNTHHNSQPSGEIAILGKTFKEKISISNLQPFEGDYILESRFGSGIRLGSTSRDALDTNPWSKVGEEGDPIIIIGNGYNFTSTRPYVESLENDKSSIILTSTQAIPLKNDKIDLNPFTKPIEIDKYSSGQVFLNADRVVLNAKKDEVILLSKSNIEFYTKNVINLNAQERVHVNSTKIFLGTNKKGELADEPLLLGDKSVDWLDEMGKALVNFCSALSKVQATPEGTPLLEINAAAQQLGNKIEVLLNKTEDLKSKQNYTV